jgi:hypothetical protein
MNTICGSSRPILIELAEVSRCARASAGSAKAVEAGHQEARAEILERAGRPVKQLEDAKPRIGRVGNDQRRREIERFRAQGGQGITERIAFEEGREQGRAERRQPRPLVPPGRIEFHLPGWHIEPAVRCGAATDRLRDRD